MFEINKSVFGTFLAERRKVLSVIPFGFWGTFGIENVILIGYLAGLFVPVWIAGRRHG